MDSVVLFSGAQTRGIAAAKGAFYPVCGTCPVERGGLVGRILIVAPQCKLRNLRHRLGVAVIRQQAKLCQRFIYLLFGALKGVGHGTGLLDDSEDIGQLGCVTLTNGLRNHL